MTEQILSFLPDVHFIYTSCFNDFDFAQQALRLGVSSYITKPIDFDELTKSIIRVISQREEDVKRKLLECDLRKQLKTHRSDLIEHFFTDLLFKISMDPGSLKYRAQYLEIPLDGQFRLVVLQVDHEYQDNIDAGIFTTNICASCLRSPFYAGTPVTYSAMICRFSFDFAGRDVGQRPAFGPGRAAADLSYGH